MTPAPSVERVIGLGLPPEIPSAPLVLPWLCLCSDNGRFYPGPDGELRLTSEYTRSKTQIKQRAKLWWRGREILSGDVQLTVRFWFPDRRKRDSGNYRKGLTDALTKVVYADDQQVADERYIRAGYDKVNPRCEVSIALLPAIAEAA